MPVVQIRCPHCQGEFIESRAAGKDEDVARCPKCGETIATHAIEVESATNEHGRVVHVEPTVAMPLDRRDEAPPGPGR